MPVGGALRRCDPPAEPGARNRAARSAAGARLTPWNRLPRDLSLSHAPRGRVNGRRLVSCPSSVISCGDSLAFWRSEPGIRLVVPRSGPRASSAATCCMTRWFDTPTALHPPAQGWRRSRLPWESGVMVTTTLQGLNQFVCSADSTPSGLRIDGRRWSQGRSLARSTLGWKMQRLQRWNASIARGSATLGDVQRSDPTGLRN
ncbi:hypothetical protein PLANPX_5792 [Lacipirellula parvula]|uniref:Uncharacterized protein n=1 Tax=Lacipirellula parvula TaxID=2650471 RepID=A0A5K7XH29_9BACT|nr:hypothetical protein PLANPX_5792 [Lacipirellula parvula]